MIAIMSVMILDAQSVLHEGQRVDLVAPIGREDLAEWMIQLFSLPGDPVYYESGYDAAGGVYGVEEIRAAIRIWRERFEVVGVEMRPEV